MEKNKNERNLEYEKKFRAYLFRGNWERHKDICKNINVVESTPKTRAEK
jgi:hypothetical protein